ncbi:hypothetical protein ACH5RR_000265 [Cinchona calisaya]|uniref:Gelsolin-like domain-containing protein n=1 Tax=Cinchona calisaya TaxID=153742 RepID=A0ABD3B134_9GENT
MYEWSRDLVPCILVTFEKEQIFIWRGRDCKSKEEGFFVSDRQVVDDPHDDMVQPVDETDDLQGPQHLILVMSDLSGCRVAAS